MVVLSPRHRRSADSLDEVQVRPIVLPQDRLTCHACGNLPVDIIAGRALMGDHASGSAVFVALGWTWWAVVFGPLVYLVRVPDCRPDQAGHRLREAGSAGDLQYPLSRHVEQGG